jgi:hypothetical protein
MVLRSRLLVNAFCLFGSVVDHEGDSYSFVDSSIVHYPIRRIGSLIDAGRGEL